MKKIFLIIIVIASLLFSYCGSHVPEKFAAISTASFAVPCMFRSDMRGGGYTILEKDDYGRVLFAMTEYCILLGAQETVIVIMQKHSDQYVYFYEDICYVTEDKFDEAESSFKELNDWNLPIDESKMSRRKVKYSMDNNLVLDFKEDFSKIRYRWSKELETPDVKIIDYTISDFDGVEYSLYIIVTENEADEKDYYFSIVDIDSYEAKYMKIQDIGDFLDDLISFKKSSNWHYGF